MIRGRVGRALVSGSVASLTSALALALTAKAERRGAAQPLNATSHWRYGPGAARVAVPDLRHTGVGYATHHAACVFWALIFDRWIARSRTPVALARTAAGTAIVAAAADYIATPKRFTPGWEYVLSKRSMALVYAALGAGLTLGAHAIGRAAD